MPEKPQRTSKQVAQRYKGNLSYYLRPQSLRTLQARLLWYAIILGILALVFYVGYSWFKKDDGEMGLMGRLFNPGPVSQAHAAFEGKCVECHRKPALMQASVKASPLDAACMECHEEHTFHQATVPRSHACTACHHEHTGSGPMQAVMDANCVSCHGSENLMLKAREDGRNLPEAKRPRLPNTGQRFFTLDRPEDGYTRVFARFDAGHPEFQIHREKVADSTPLKFNHHVHLQGDIPPVNGKKLDCASCHQPEAGGAYMRPISFEEHCQVCHALQFDMRTPELELPHGSVDAVRNYIQNLPDQYAKFAREQGVRDKKKIQSFVSTRLEALRREVQVGRPLEESIFFSDGKNVPGGRIALMPSKVEGMRYAGCAYCHEVERNDVGIEVKSPEIPDRWLSNSRFDHAGHKQMKCTECHQGEESQLTSDVLLPGIADCVKCHSREGKVVSNCQTCHSYHELEPVVAR